MKGEEYIESINISLSTLGWKDERMKGDEYRKVSKYKYISKYFRMQGWKDKRMKGCKDERMKEWKNERRRVYGKYLSMNISLSTTGWKDERMKEWKNERRCVLESVYV